MYLGNIRKENLSKMLKKYSVLIWQNVNYKVVKSLSINQFRIGPALKSRK